MVKAVVAGGFAVGKTTFVSTVSEVPSLHTEGVMTEAGRHVDDLTGVAQKTTTTVSADYGRLTIDEHLVLYLFGSPGQERFRVLWDELTRGALGVLILIDTSRIQAAWEVMDMVETRGLPYAVAVNRFPGAPDHPLDEVRKSLDLTPDTPLVSIDARVRDDCLDALFALTRHVIHHRRLELP